MPGDIVTGKSKPLTRFLLAELNIELISKLLHWNAQQKIFNKLIINMCMSQLFKCFALQYYTSSLVK